MRYVGNALHRSHLSGDQLEMKMRYIVYVTDRDLAGNERAIKVFIEQRGPFLIRITVGLWDLSVYVFFRLMRKNETGIESKCAD